MILLGPNGDTVDPSRLRVRVEPVEHDLATAVDRSARARGRVLEREDFSVCALGTALVATSCVLRRDSATFARFLHELGHARSEVAPIALGVFPFDPQASGSLVVPSVALIRRRETPDVLITIEHAEQSIDLGALLEEPMGTAGARAPDHFKLESVISHQAFCDNVEDALKSIESGELEKVVLAREVLVEANRPFVQRELLERIRALHPSCLLYAIDGLVGASPELVVRRRDTDVLSVPLAGTIARSGDPSEDRRLAGRLLGSEKERREHQHVVDAIARSLSNVGAHVMLPDEPHVLELRNVVHLATAISATLPPKGPTSLELVAALHPTPAIAGSPSQAALEYLRANEALCRDRYGGVVGYLDANGDGEWWLAIRSALVDDRRARLLAGVGIVRGSDPDAELAETQLKLQAMLAVVVRP